MTQHLERTNIRRRSDVASRIIEGEAIIVKIKTGENYSLNHVGALVWQMADGTHTLADIVTAIADRYDITVDQAQADLSELVSELEREQLVEVGEAPLYS